MVAMSSMISRESTSATMLRISATSLKGSPTVRTANTVGPNTHVPRGKALGGQVEEVLEVICCWLAERSNIVRNRRVHRAPHIEHQRQSFRIEQPISGCQLEI